MDIELIKKLAKEKGYSGLKALEEVCCLGNGTIGKWSHQSPSVDNLSKIADCLNVSMDCLYYGKEPTASQNAVDREQLDIIERLSPEEQRYIERFLMLSETDKVRIMERIDTLLETYPAEVKEVI